MQADRSRSESAGSFNPASRSTLAIAALLFLVAMGLYTRVGFDSALVADAGNYLYQGQQMVDGVPPYVSFFDIKTPFGAFLCALGVGLGRLVGVDDVLAVRTLFLLIAGLCVVSLYYLVLLLFRSRWQAVLSSVVFLGFAGFGVVALSGPMPKTAAATLVTACLALMVGRQWFWAALVGCLAGLTWQPAGAFALAAILLAWFQTVGFQTVGFQTEGRRPKRKAVLHAGLGALLPVSLTSLYFASHGALSELIDGALLSHLESGRRAATLLGTWGSMLESLFRGFGGASFIVALGLLMIGVIAIWRWQNLPEPTLRALAADRFGPLLLTFPLPVLWSLWDFQAYPDFFVFLPYAAVGFGWLLTLGLEMVTENTGIEGRGRKLLPIGAAVFMLLLAAGHYDFGLQVRRAGLGTRLPEQQRALKELMLEYGQDTRVLSVGVPQAMALLKQRNPTRFLGPTPRFASRIETRVDGGFAAWLDEVRQSQPELLFVQPHLERSFDERQARLWGRWIQGYEEIPRVGGFRVLVARDLDPGDIDPNASRVASSASTESSISAR